jgi:hypothetical protein
MASTGQARAHAPQWMQMLFRTMTPPPSRCEYAPVGQASAHGATGSQARQCLASYPVESPPVDLMRMPALFHERFLYTYRAQAKEQEWQPMQRSILGVVRIFTSTPPGMQILSAQTSGLLSPFQFPVHLSFVFLALDLSCVVRKGSGYLILVERLRCRQNWRNRHDAAARLYSLPSMISSAQLDNLYAVICFGVP